MNLAKYIFLGVVGLALQGTAVAQIYESTDAEGVPDFSDTPTSGAEVVDLPETNVVDAPPDVPEAAQSEAPPPAPAAAGNSGGEIGEPSYNVYGGDYDEDDDDVRARRRVDEDRVDKALPGDNGPGVGAPDVGIEPHRVEGEAGRQ